MHAPLHVQKKDRLNRLKTQFRARYTAEYPERTNGYVLTVELQAVIVTYVNAPKNSSETRIACLFFKNFNVIDTGMTFKKRTRTIKKNILSYIKIKNYTDCYLGITKQNNNNKKKSYTYVLINYKLNPIVKSPHSPAPPTSTDIF